MLAAWNQVTGEKLWELPLGTRLPQWGASDDGIVLGFPDGALVGIEAATCDYWSITIGGGIDDLAVLESGAYVARSGVQLAGFSGRGQGIWRFDGGDSEYRYVADNAAIAVFIDRFGDLIGLTTGGEQVFAWGGVADSTAVAVGETLLFRSTGAEVAARPVGGGGVVWTMDLPAVDALLSVPGTLLAAGGEMLHALEPQTGQVRWSIPFAGEIAPPAVLDHGELHVAARRDELGHTVWHFDPTDGRVLFAGNAPEGFEWFPEMDDALVLEVGDVGGVLRGVDMRTREVFALVTGANRVDRFSQVERAAGAVILTLTFSAERF